MRNLGRTFYTAGNRAYLPGLLALCRSFLAHNPNDSIVVVLMPGSDLTRTDRNLLGSAGANFLTIPRSDLVEHITSCLPLHESKYGLETYAKIVLIERLSIPFYWIDADVIVQTKIDPIGQAITGGMATASPHPRSRGASLRDSGDERVRAWLLGIGVLEALLVETPSLNCGLMWLDPERLRTAGFLTLVQQALRTFPEQLVSADESIFNLLATTFDIQFFPEHSQMYMSADPSAGTDDGDATSESAWVVHFVGHSKPWIVGPKHIGWGFYQKWLSADEFNP